MGGPRGLGRRKNGNGQSNVVCMNVGCEKYCGGSGATIFGKVSGGNGKRNGWSGRRQRNGNGKRDGSNGRSGRLWMAAAKMGGLSSEIGDCWFFMNQL